MEKSYFEIKVTFVHVFILLVAVIAIGVLLFYMGYQAGGKAARPTTAAVPTETLDANSLPVSEVAEKPLAGAQPAAAGTATIQEEARLHQVPIAGSDSKQPAAKPSDAAATTPVEPAPAKPALKKPETGRVEKPRPAPGGDVYTIQVGAFSDFGNAKRYADRYMKLNLPAEIIAKTVAGRKWHTVRVGRFATMAEARSEQARLERLENKKFQIEKTR